MLVSLSRSDRDFSFIEGDDQLDVKVMVPCPDTK